MRFGARQVIRDLALTVAHGSSLAIIGPTGVGKSVLLRALLGSIPSEGVISWAPGTRVGYVPQKLDLERDLPMTGNDLLRTRLTLGWSPVCFERSTRSNVWPMVTPEWPPMMIVSPDLARTAGVEVRRVDLA